MSARRLQKELSDMKAVPMKTFRDITVDEKNILNWTALLVPEKEPYNKGAFKISIEFPEDYPFKPPKITFLTKIYHPNVEEKGSVCLRIAQAENWKPSTKVTEVVESLVALMNEPEVENSLRGDLANQYTNDRTKFLK